MLTIALTGGIGSGKSAVADEFAALGVPIIDADILARELVHPGMPALREIVEAFGAGVLDADGTLNRRALRQCVFQDLNARRRLEAILHPRIRARMRQRLQQLESAYAVLVIPLLLETRQTDLADRVLVVDLPEALQLQRVMRRDRQDAEQVRAILAAQCSRAQRLAAADDVIDNSGNPEQLRTLTRSMHNHYMSLSRNS